MRDVYGDRWRVKDALGSGGQSDVYLVEDTSDEFRETCALKQLQGDSKLGRFKQEIRVLRELEHPNIVRILDASLDDSDPYLVMKYYEQGSLADHPEEWLDAPARGISFFLGIVDAVRTGHERGVVHRDLKPGNILIEDHKSSSYPDFSLAFTSDFYRPVVSDFGICYYEEGDRHTRTKEAVGPRDYIAPELEDRRVENVDPVSDVYSLGKLLYWILSGGEVFTRERHRERDYDLVDITGNASLEMVNRVLDNMIVEDPRDRYSTLGPVVRGVRSFLCFRPRLRSAVRELMDRGSEGRCGAAELRQTPRQYGASGWLLRHERPVSALEVRPRERGLSSPDQRGAAAEADRRGAGGLSGVRAGMEAR